MLKSLTLNSRKQSHSLSKSSCDKPSVCGIFYDMESIEYKEYKGYPRFNLMGKVFTKLTVIGCAGVIKKVNHWICKCECGKIKTIKAQSLTEGNTKSCGCLVLEKAYAKPPEQRSRKYAIIVAGIYSVTNPKGEIYVGSSKTIYKRWIRHREAKRKLKFYESLREYGWREHKWEIIEEHPNEVTEAELIVREQFYIDKFKSEGRVMMNVKEAGSSGKFPEESRKKMALAQKGRIPWNKGLKKEIKKT